jgi:hypothetical protein
MLTRRTALVIAAALAVSLPLPAAAEEAPDAVVAALYEAHAPRANDASIPPLWEDPETSARYFDDDLLALFVAMKARQAATPDEVVGLDGDPFYDAQDWDISNLVVAPAEISGDAATVDVRFDNFGEPRHLIYGLLRGDGAWRVFDVTYVHPDRTYTLREILSSG